MENKDMNQKKPENTELDENAMSGVSGGCFLWGALGSHDYDMIDSYPVTTAGGTRYYYLKYRCRDCGKVFYFRKTGASGSKEEISEGDYNANRSKEDSF